MFTFKFKNELTNVFDLRSKKQIKPKYFEPLFDTRYEPPSPGEIRQMVKKLSRCGNCHFLIFDNYWLDDVEKNNIKLCPTCGYKL
ncbi:MAG: hypothetical protein HY094_08710 [Candidatus Melainabacteria bacterium]|nr:hypothetical protein [Candidatus Melainabacteria bacterium]